MPQWGSMVTDTIILIGLVANLVYVRSLEKNIDALKEWIEVFWQIDFGKMAEAIAKEKRKRKGE